MDSMREKAFQDYRKKLMEHKEVESRLKDSKYWNRFCRIIISCFRYMTTKPFLFDYFYQNMYLKYLL